LRLMPHRHYSFRSSSTKSIPEVIPIDDVNFEKSVKTKEIQLVVEWSESAHDSIRNVVNKVVMDSEYSKWKKEKKSGQSKDRERNRGRQERAKSSGSRSRSRSRKRR